MLVSSPEDFDYLAIGLASPDKIRYWSYGEVEKPETINYRTFKPERRGLFCEKIFGPVKDWECSCGKYRRVRYRGIVCERCGVEVTHSKVRRERMGHIELAADVAHIWFLKGIPTYMGLVLDLSSRQLEEVVYYDSYIVTDVADSIKDAVEVKQILSTTEYAKLKEKYGEKFKADMGAGAIKQILAKLDLKKLTIELRDQLVESKGQKRLKVTKRLRIVESLYKSGNKPEWMVLEVIPVMPPDLRPMVQLEGGRFATSDLNDLYRRVVNRNNRLKRLMDIGAPEMIIRNEKRMLQEAVDVLISNGKRGRSVTGSNGRPLKSLGNIIEGKQGRFRQNLLGKRVDYSARSVIVVGPDLKFHQCGLPKEMALELFKPFIIRKLVEDGFASNVKSAKRKIERKDVVVWDCLDSVIKGKLVLLNRAPTLHRLGIQAFEPVLVEGSAIQIHPLVCTAFNADFDGDQMAVHVPLSLEAQTESRLLILSNNNILSPSSGRSIVTPTQDMTLGIYFLTVDSEEPEKQKPRIFADVSEAWRAWSAKAINLHSRVVVRIDGDRVKTTFGRVVFNAGIWEVLERYELPKAPFIDEVVGKKKLGDLVFDWYLKYGNLITADLADKLKQLGFKYSTLSGISISIEDMVIPSNKAEILKNAEKEIKKLETLFKAGTISGEEKQMRAIDIWRGATQSVSDALEQQLGKLNNVFIMANSGARGNIDQVRQLSGMRGLMSDAQGRTVDIPIKSNFKEGLTLTEYFISSYGARKGLVDTALRTADSGYLTRRLVDVGQDVMITVEDCGSKEGIDLKAVRDGIVTVVPLAEMIEGRFSLEEVRDPNATKHPIVIKKGDLITKEQANKTDLLGVKSLKIRSIYTCQAERGICQKCYGLDLASHSLISIGEAIGIIAAQSIGEPGTQLTMRTFHTGGVDLRGASKVEVKAKKAGVAGAQKELRAGRIRDEHGQTIWVSSVEGSIQVSDEKGDTTSYLVPKGSTILAKPDQKVSAGVTLAEYDPSFEYVISENEGVVKLFDVNLQEAKDEKGNVTERFGQKPGEVFVYDPAVKKNYEVSKSIASKFEKGQKVTLDSDFGAGNRIESGSIISSIKKGSASKSKKESKDDGWVIETHPGVAYPVTSGARFYLTDGEKVAVGDIVARERLIGADVSKTKDIVQGLPRVEELFEARRPKDPAILSEADGVVEISNAETHRVMTVTSEDNVRKEYKIPYGVRLKVYSGKQVAKGDALTDGVLDPHDVLVTKGVYATQTYLCDEVQKVYRSQGVQINSKHIEVVVRQMTRKLNVVDIGDSTLLPNELVDQRKFEKVNEKLADEGKQTAKGDKILLGITRASLNTESFVSASSFQQTASVLTKAAIEGQVDPMYGLKENVIIGKLIPAGTGLTKYTRVALEYDEPQEIPVVHVGADRSDLNGMGAEE